MGTQFRILEVRALPVLKKHRGNIFLSCWWWQLFHNTRNSPWMKSQPFLCALLSMQWCF